MMKVVFSTPKRRKKGLVGDIQRQVEEAVAINRVLANATILTAKYRMPQIIECCKKIVETAEELGLNIYPGSDEHPTAEMVYFPDHDTVLGELILTVGESCFREGLTVGQCLEEHLGKLRATLRIYETYGSVDETGLAVLIMLAWAFDHSIGGAQNRRLHNNFASAMLALAKYYQAIGLIIRDIRNDEPLKSLYNLGKITIREVVLPFREERLGDETAVDVLNSAAINGCKELITAEDVVGYLQKNSMDSALWTIPGFESIPTRPHVIPALFCHVLTRELERLGRKKAAVIVRIGLSPSMREKLGKRNQFCCMLCEGYLKMCREWLEDSGECHNGDGSESGEGQNNLGSGGEGRGNDSKLEDRDKSEDRDIVSIDGLNIPVARAKKFREAERWQRQRLRGELDGECRYGYEGKGDCSETASERYYNYDYLRRSVDATFTLPQGTREDVKLRFMRWIDKEVGRVYGRIVGAAGMERGAGDLLEDVERGKMWWDKIEGVGSIAMDRVAEHGEKAKKPCVMVGSEDQVVRKFEVPESP
ncbi:hypothetical protein ABW19_dt0200769 [Dactylella cylindrospora]|nr:hypothetical protein ABW19_dt0200769 [Dactylella cylindrospora]